MVERNVVKRAVSGSVVQARDIHGDVHVHAPGLTVPRQLPRAGANIVGRDGELDALNGMARVTVISGMAGVGKTALCLHWARSIAERFPDGQLYVDMRGFDPSHQPLATADAVRGFLDGFGVSPERIRPDVVSQVNLYRSIIADRKVLVVLDNARDAEQVRPLLPTGQGCVAVITSRTELTGLLVDGGVHRTWLGLLDEHDARELVAGRIAGALASDDAVGDLASMCAGLPLALAVIAAQAAQHRFPLRFLVERLRSARPLLDALDTGDPRTTARSVFSWSYETLSPAAQRIFRYLGLMTGADIALPAVASLVAMPAARTRIALAELLQANLLEEYLPGRFRLHDLLREYSTDLLDGEPEQDRIAAATRMIDSYLCGAMAADVMLKPQRLRIVVPPPSPGVGLTEIPDYRSALDWWGAEQQLVVTAVDLAVQHGLDRQAWQLAWAFDTYLRRHSHPRVREHVQRQALIAARRIRDAHSQGWICLLLGKALLRQERTDEAEEFLEEAVGLFHVRGQPGEEAHALVARAMLRWRQGRVEEADTDARRALTLAEASDTPNVRATASDAIGRFSLDLGAPEETIRRCTAALELYRVIGNSDGEAATWRSLGSACRELGRWGEAIAHYERSLEIDIALGDDYYAAIVLDALGLTYAAIGRRPDAEAAWMRSLALLEYLEHPQAVEVRARLGRR